MRRHAGLLITALLVAGCGARALEAQATLPAARSSAPLAVYTRDSHPGLLNANTAQLVAASGESLVFHVQVTDLNPIVVEPDRWAVWLEDDAGHRLGVPTRDAAMLKRLSVEFRPVRRTIEGPVILVKRDRPADAYLGEATYAFQGVTLQRGRPVTLVVKRRADDLELRWRWQLGDQLAYHHYGITPADIREGYQPLPGAVSRVASSTDVQ